MSQHPGPQSSPRLERHKLWRGGGEVESNQSCCNNEHKDVEQAGGGWEIGALFRGLFGPTAKPEEEYSWDTGEGEPPVARSNEPGASLIPNYWQNYDISVSVAPKLFSDEEFKAVSCIRAGLEVLILRKRLKERISMKFRRREERAAVRVQAVCRGMLTRCGLARVRKEQAPAVALKKQLKLFKRHLRSEGFVMYAYRTKDGGHHRVTLKPNGKLNSLTWARAANVKRVYIPLISLKACYTGYPKRDFPTRSMQARATALPNRDKAFTIERDNGKFYIFMSAEELGGPTRTNLVRGLQAIIEEVSCPDSFYFDEMGVLRRVTRSIFDDRGNTAYREMRRKKREQLLGGGSAGQT